MSEPAAPAAGDKVEATVVDNGHLPGKKDFLTGAVTYAVTGSIKWFEIRYQYNIPAVAEVAILTVAVTAASYFTPEHFTQGHKPTLRDIVTGLATAIASGCIKAFEEATSIDVPAEYEAIITGGFVTIASGFVPSKTLKVTAAP